MWRILAYCREDGWAILEHAGTTGLLRPPYTGQVTPIDPAALPRLLAEPGMVCPSAEHQQHPSRRAPLDFLNAEILRSRAEAGRALPEDGYGPRMLAMAPAPVLARMLDRIERELVAQGRHEPARAALLAVLSAPAGFSNPNLHQRAVALMTRMDAAARGRSRLLADAADFSARFPRVAGKFGTEPLRQFNAAISGAHDIFGLNRAA